MIDFNATAADAAIIDKIVTRAIGLYGRGADRLSLTMDVTACHLNGCPLKLQALLDADDFNFSHDISGIARHLDRQTGELGDCFLPRFAQPCQEPAEDDGPQMRGIIERAIEARQVRA